MATCSVTTWAPSQIAGMPLVRTGCGLRADRRRCDACTETCDESLTCTFYGGVLTIALTCALAGPNAELLTHVAPTSYPWAPSGARGEPAWKARPLGVSPTGRRRCHWSP